MGEQNVPNAGSNKKSSDNTPPIPILKDGWTKMPIFFVDELMVIAAGIPASFWKYLMVLWRDIMGLKPGYFSKKTMDDFHIGKNAACKWTAALSVSCLFKVRYGQQHRQGESGEPTIIYYLPQSTQEDWIAFLTAVRDTLQMDREEHNGDVHGFRIALALALITERKASGLSAKWLEAWVQSLENRGIITRDVLGNPQWSRRPTNRQKVLTARDVETAFGNP